MNTISAKRATSIRLDKDLYAYIEKLAKKEHRSLNNFIETVLSRATRFDTPNKETIDAVEEIEKGDVLRFDSIDSLFDGI